ncbi:MAG: TRAP transporter small permease subunit [Helicobacteraceae bacterium]|jgi:TRAP-type mannitol/chloroaromatic compound transport system permease small subunit|nr:TRAP transporter small permease subunit [Helicobacteraceae bacterium]
MFLKLENSINKTVDKIGNLNAIVMVLMMLNVCYDVIMRYFFNDSKVAFQELEWHLFSFIILIGLAYTLKEDAHVRVDIFYERFQPKSKAIINVIGSVLFIIPFSLLLIYGGYEFAYDSYTMGEISGNPGGLTQRWIVKSFIAIRFILLILATIGFIIRNINVFLNVEKPTEYHVEDNVL